MCPDPCILNIGKAALVTLITPIDWSQSEPGNPQMRVSIAFPKEFLFIDSYSYFISSIGPNRWYFETGQGSELSAEAHQGIDQLTLEARCYGIAKNINPWVE